jgi:hypothetical protein
MPDFYLNRVLPDDSRHKARCPYSTQHSTFHPPWSALRSPWRQSTIDAHHRAMDSTHAAIIRHVEHRGGSIIRPRCIVAPIPQTDPTISRNVEDNIVLVHRPSSQLPSYRIAFTPEERIGLRQLVIGPPDHTFDVARQLPGLDQGVFRFSDTHLGVFQGLPSYLLGLPGAASQGEARDMFTLGA